MSEHNALLESYIRSLGANIAVEYAIAPEAYQDQSIKRGLRNADGTGVVIGISHQLKVPVKYIGLGEKMTDLQPFNRKEFVQSLFS